MSKELEALEKLKSTTKFDGGINYSFGDKKEFKIIENALKRLETIDNASSSEALGCNLKLYKMVESAGNGNGFNLNEAWEYHNTIKQVLIKAQEMEKVLELIKNKARFYDNNTKCKIEIEADDFNSSEEWEQVKGVLI